MAAWVESVARVEAAQGQVGDFADIGAQHLLELLRDIFLLGLLLFPPRNERGLLAGDNAQQQDSGARWQVFIGAAGEPENGKLLVSGWGLDLIHCAAAGAEVAFSAGPPGGGF